MKTSKILTNHVLTDNTTTTHEDIYRCLIEQAIFLQQRPLGIEEISTKILLNFGENLSEINIKAGLTKGLEQNTVYEVADEIYNVSQEVLEELKNSLAYFESKESNF